MVPGGSTPVEGIARDTPPLFIVLMLSGCRGWLLSSRAEAIMLGRTDAFEVFKEATSMPTSDGIRAFGSSRLMFKVLCLYPLTPVSGLNGPWRSSEEGRFTHSQESSPPRGGSLGPRGGMGSGDRRVEGAAAGPR